MESSTYSLAGVLTGALSGFLLGVAVGLLVVLVDPGAVNPLFFGSIGCVVGAGLAGDRPRPADDRPEGTR